MNNYCMHGLNDKNIEYIKEFPQNSLVFFDDGLASLYKYKDFLKEYHNVKFIIGITPYIALQADKEKNIDLKFIKCSKAHNLVKSKKDFSHYLNSNMIKELSKYCEIGDHSWDHFLFEKKYKKLKEKTLYYKSLVEKSYNFYETLNIKINKYIRPYNKLNTIYEIVFISKFKIPKENIFGGERKSGAWNSYFQA